MEVSKPDCPYECPVCGKTLQPWGHGTDTLNYACREHVWQEADYDPEADEWSDKRVPSTT